MSEPRRKTGTHSADDALVGQTVAERYRVLKRIGAGGMGAVYVSEHLTTGKRVALKILLPGLGKLEDVAKRFEREAQAASLLRHPNVVDVLDFGRLPDGTLFMVMEYVRGRSLGELLDKGPLGVERSLRIARHVLEALGAAHTAGIIHRDLKPDNVMLVDVGESESERDFVKLLDFGIARIVGEAEAIIGGGNLTQAGVAFGTPDYMAPEQALGEPVDGRADLYAMGVMLFEMISGRKPFESEDRMTVVRMHVGAPIPRLKDAVPAGTVLTGEIEALIARALSKRRDERFSDAAEMIDGVERAARSLRSTLGGGAPSLRRVTSHTMARLRKGWTRPLLFRAAVLGLPVLTLAVVLLMVFLRREAPRHAPPPSGMPQVSERASRANAWLAQGDAVRALTALEADARSGALVDDPWSWLLLGHARSRTGKTVEALAAYEAGVLLDLRLAADESMRAQVVSLIATDDEALALAAMEFLGRRVGAPGAEILLAYACGANKGARLPGALARASRGGGGAPLDRLRSYSLDLEQAKSCPQRLAAVGKLGALGDPRGATALKKSATVPLLSKEEDCGAKAAALRAAGELEKAKPR